MANKNLIIRNVRVRAANIPLKRPLVASVAQFTHWVALIVDIETEGDVRGRGYICPYLPQTAAAFGRVAEMLAEGWIGRTVAPARMYDEGMKRIQTIGQNGVGLGGLAAMDVALWDTFARAHDMPLAVALGAEVAPVKAYNSSGLWLQDPELLAREAVELRDEHGFSAVKMRFGRETIAEDVQSARNVMEAVPGTIVMSDFNQGLSYSEAVNRLRALDDEGLHWFEEPIIYSDLAGCARLSEKMRTPIMLGENFHGPRDMHEALKANACDMVMPDLMRIGGVTGWMRAAAIAQQYSVEVSSHLMAEISAHLMLATPTRGWLEWTDWLEPILKDPFTVKDGEVHVPDTPGVGVEWDEAALDRYAL
ncbi:MAG: mandelate racemase [Alphaproteobacteria bacterium]|jgi:mandelate racemase|nr:mandelate racemase [Alphaproteobacteria bacterium]